MRSLPDDKLVELLRQGNGGALGVLYERHAHDLFVLLFAKLHKRDLAEDVHAELWLRLAGGSSQRRNDSDPEPKPSLLEKFQGGNFRAWFFTCAKNFAVDVLRK